MQAGDHPILVYDGECPRCAAAAKWVARRTGVVAVPWQDAGDLSRLGLTRQHVDESAWWIGEGEPRGGAAAVSRALRAAGGPWWLLGWAIDHPPLRPLAAAAYRAAARRRRRSAARG